MEVELFVTDDGHCPYREWLASLRDPIAVHRVRNRIARIRGGNFGDSRAIGGGVVELRLHFGPGYRIYFGRARFTVVVLLCAGDKDSQQADIELARTYWTMYEEQRHGEG